MGRFFVMGLKGLASKVVRDGVRKKFGFEVAFFEENVSVLAVAAQAAV